VLPAFYQQRASHQTLLHILFLAQSTLVILLCMKLRVYTAYSFLMRLCKSIRMQLPGVGLSSGVVCRPTRKTNFVIPCCWKTHAGGVSISKPLSFSIQLVKSGASEKGVGHITAVADPGEMRGCISHRHIEYIGSPSLNGGGNAATVPESEITQVGLPQPVYMCM